MARNNVDYWKKVYGNEWKGNYFEITNWFVG